MGETSAGGGDGGRDLGLKRTVADAVLMVQADDAWLTSRRLQLRVRPSSNHPGGMKAFTRPRGDVANLKNRLARDLQNNFYYTSSGFFDKNALRALIRIVRKEGVLFSVDYSCESIDTGAQRSDALRMRTLRRRGRLITRNPADSHLHLLSNTPKLGTNRPVLTVLSVK